MQNCPGWFVLELVTQTLTAKIPFIQSRTANVLLVTTAIMIAIGIFLPMGSLAYHFK